MTAPVATPVTTDLPDEVDVLVVGAGLMGAMTAWAAGRRGLRVLVLEQFAPGHERGSSHGSARIVRRAYPDPMYVRLTGQAFELWTELEAQIGAPLLRMTGGLDHGAARDLAAIAVAFDAAGVDYELLDGVAAESRWLGMRFEEQVLFHPQAGTVDADRAVTAALSLARRDGAVVASETAAQSIRVSDDSAVVTTGAGDVRASRVVVAAGAWLEPLSADILGAHLELPPFRVSQQQIFHFARAAGIPEWPTAVHKGALQTYSLAGGRDGGAAGARKIAQHDAPGYDTTADSRSGAVDPAARDRIVRYVREWMPGLIPEPFAEATCLYTSTSNDDFVLDRVGPVVVCSPCSGHGAKFAPLIGEMAVDLAAGGEPNPRFALAAHRTRGRGAVGER